MSSEPLFLSGRRRFVTTLAGAAADFTRQAYSGPLSDVVRDKIDTDGFNHPRKIYGLTDSLMRRDYGESQIQAVLGANFRRLLGSTWI
jgi:microsomal dipeptidase-like Zn-dependent dipeptidase